jgi:hypothetical protein
MCSNIYGQTIHININFKDLTKKTLEQIVNDKPYNITSFQLTNIVFGNIQ